MRAHTRHFRSFPKYIQTEYFAYPATHIIDQACLAPLRETVILNGCRCSCKTTSWPNHQQRMYKAASSGKPDMRPIQKKSCGGIAPRGW
jgi:hypothetical protein